VHVTVRVRAGLPNLRRRDAVAVIERALARGADRFGWRLVHYSIQSTHLHFISEVRDRRALSRGMQGLAVRLARALNRFWNRTGSVFADRFHSRALRTPREVRIALLYVLQNARRHGLRLLGVDACSSGAWFDGWTRPIVTANRAQPTVSATTWLLHVGWRRHGLIGHEESPGRSRPRSSNANPSR
jgi:REP element-mobilizing transposase RayT